MSITVICQARKYVIKVLRALATLAGVCLAGCLHLNPSLPRPQPGPLPSQDGGAWLGPLVLGLAGAVALAAWLGYQRGRRRERREQQDLNVEEEALLRTARDALSLAVTGLLRRWLGRGGEGED